MRHGGALWSGRGRNENERGLIQYRMQGGLSGEPREQSGEMAWSEWDPNETDTQETERGI